MAEDKKKPKSKKDQESATESAASYSVLVQPWITEAATIISQLNKYIFQVQGAATKKQIEKSVERLYGVDVISVRTITLPRKKRIRGAQRGWKTGVKKAIVTVKEGQKIEFFEGK